MAPRAAKRARIAADDVQGGQSPSRDPLDDPNTSASHLVSFLTGYDASRPVDDDAYGDRDHDEDDDDYDAEKYDGSEDDADEDVDVDGDEDGELLRTPSKRSKTGLVGTPSSSRGTPTKRTPKKTPTPRKPKPTMLTIDDSLQQAGFIRPSKSDAYFNLTSRASRTSGNSYSALVRPLSQAGYEKHAASARAKGKSKQTIEDIRRGMRSSWNQWELELEQGFNLLLYGYGSKRRVINDFATGRLAKRGHCIVINGHFPGLGIKDVLSQIEDSLSIPQDTPLPASATTPLERSAYRTYAHFLPASAIPKAKKQEWLVSTKPLFLIIHNIDSPSMRTPRSVAILSLLACSPNIHLIASFDHLQTPLLFSASTTNAASHTYDSESWTGSPPACRGFDWVYHNITTFDDYDLELTYQRLSSSAAIGGISSTAGAGLISEEGALQILRSVPPMASRLLKLLLMRQLDSLPSNPTSHTAHPPSATAPEFAVDNDTLQRLSREKFIAREEERYNALMGEFKDHGLVVEAQMDSEGRTGRWIWVPLGKAAIERVIESMADIEV